LRSASIIAFSKIGRRPIVDNDVTN
jgi:hypothetical protein